jgi:sugar phosphate isomerase/epimerase
VNLGYNTNGFAHHDLLDAIVLLGEIGYRSVAITIDHGALAPDRPETPAQLQKVRRMLRTLGMRSVIETGARFLLDPRRKHEPTLISSDAAARSRRIEFYKHAVRCAVELESDCVSLWSGTAERLVPGDLATDWLVRGLREVLDYAAQRQVVIAFEPEPGMLIDTMARYEELLRLVDAPNFRLTLDVGHLQCQGELPIGDSIRRFGPRLANVHVEDMRRGVHEHLMFGEGEVDFSGVLQALGAVGYQGGLHVELSRHSREAPEAARRAFEFLDPLVQRWLPPHGSVR